MDMKTGGVGLVNGNVEHCDMDIDNVEEEPEFSVTATQVQDMKFLLITLSMLSRSVKVRNRLFEKVATIALRTDDYEAQHHHETEAFIINLIMEPHRKLIFRMWTKP